MSVLQIILLFIVSSIASAGMPVWTFTPLTATTLTLSTTTSATVQYTVTNQSHKTHSLTMKSIPAVRQITTGTGVCGNPFVLGYKQSCILSFEIDGSLLQFPIVGGPVVCQISSGNTPNPNACYQPNSNNQLHVTRSSVNMATILANPTELALSVNCPASSSSCTSSNAALTGTPRKITITNSSAYPALNVTYSATSLPAGTSITPTSCDISAGSNCVFTITPGQVPSAAPGDLSPTPISLSFAGNNTNTISTSINILTYGSVYQGGYLFSVDDSTSDTTSIAGKIAAIADQSINTPWQPDCTDSATCTTTNANSYTDGEDNTTAIVTALSSTYTPDAYAGGICSSLEEGGYTDWYLPALCELSYQDVGMNPCGSESSPTLQNMQSSLVAIGIGNLDTGGLYWSSTQNYPADPLTLALFNTFGAASQGGELKWESYSVRCARGF